MSSTSSLLADEKTIYNHQIKTPQEIYDAFNSLVFSSDTRVIHKMLTKNNLYNQVKDLNGDIFEFGVFKGASLALWLQLIKLHESHSSTLVVGFDFFDKVETLSSLSDENKELMNSVLSRGKTDEDICMDVIYEKCQKIIPNKLILIKGDARKTSIAFKNENPGARIKILYLDMDVDEPTFVVLQTMWEKVVINGLVVLDEYGFHKWDEANAVDRFLQTIPGKYKLMNTMIFSPCLVIEKLAF